MNLSQLSFFHFDLYLSLLVVDDIHAKLHFGTCLELPGKYLNSVLISVLEELPEYVFRCLSVCCSIHKDISKNIRPVN